MIVRKLFSCLFVAGFAVGLAANAAAQTNDFDGRPRVVLTNKVTVKPIEKAPITYPPTRSESRAPVMSGRSLGRFNIWDRAIISILRVPTLLIVPVLFGAPIRTWE